VRATFIDDGRTNRWLKQDTDLEIAELAKAFAHPAAALMKRVNLSSAT